MENFRKNIDLTIRWIEQTSILPSYAAEDRIPVNTGSRPLLEFGFHSGGSPSEIVVAGQRLQSHPGDLIILNAHFGNQGRPQRNWSFWCLSFDVAQSAPFAGLDEGPLLSAVPLMNPEQVVAQYQAVARQFSRRNGMHKLRLRCETLLLLATFRENLLEAKGVSGTTFRACEAALDFIHANFGRETIGLGDIAAAAGLSASQLCRVFREQTGETPISHLLRIRLTRAAELLRRSSLTISEVAYSVGYRDPLYFSRAFRKRFHYSPLAYRKADLPE